MCPDAVQVFSLPPTVYKPRHAHHRRSPSAWKGLHTSGQASSLVTTEPRTERRRQPQHRSTANADCHLPALASWGLGTPWSCASHLHGGAGMVPICQHVGLLLETQPLALRGRHAVLGLGGREGEVLPGGCLGGDGVGFWAGRRRLLLRIGGSSI